MMSKQKSKLISYCDDGTVSRPGVTTTSVTPVPTGSTNSTSTILGTKNPVAAPNPAICQKMQPLVGAFYILGPGGWLILHCCWILIVILYSKALRRQYPVDEELVRVKTATGSITNHPFSSWRRQGPGPGDKRIHGMEMGTQPYQQHPFQRAVPASESSHRLGAVFRNMNPWASSRSGSIQRSDERDGKEADQDEYDSDGDDVEKSAGGGIDSPHGSMASRTDIPADGKGWWIRQIEGKRRGEICPCTRGLQGSNAQESCWCGKQRVAYHAQSLHAESSSEAGPSTSQRPLGSHSPVGQPRDASQQQE